MGLRGSRPLPTGPAARSADAGLNALQPPGSLIESDPPRQFKGETRRRLRFGLDRGARCHRAHSHASRAMRPVPSDCRTRSLVSELGLTRAPTAPTHRDARRRLAAGRSACAADRCRARLARWDDLCRGDLAAAGKCSRVEAMSAWSEDTDDRRGQEVDRGGRRGSQGGCVQLCLDQRAASAARNRERRLRPALFDRHGRPRRGIDRVQEHRRPDRLQYLGRQRSPLPSSIATPSSTRRRFMALLRSRRPRSGRRPISPPRRFSRARCSTTPNSPNSRVSPVRSSHRPPRSSAFTSAAGRTSHSRVLRKARSST